MMKRAAKSIPEMQRQRELVFNNECLSVPPRLRVENRLLAAPNDRRWGGNKNTVWKLCLLLVLLVTSSCRENSKPNIENPSQPQRIISLVPNATEILFKLGLGDHIVAVSAFCEFPPEARKLMRVGDFQGIRVEEVIGLQPDLIIAMPTAGNRPALERLRGMGARILFIQIAGLADIFQAIQTISQACLVSQQGQALIASLQEEIEKVRKRLESSARVRVLFVVDRSPLVVAGRGSYIHDLIQIAGGENIAQDSLIPYPSFSMEEVIARRPEVIIDTGFSNEPSPAETETARRAWAQYSSIPAVASGRIICTKDTALFVPGPRLIDGLLKICRILHPDLNLNEEAGTSKTERPGISS